MSKAMNGSVIYLVESFLEENYAFRRNLLNGKTEYAIIHPQLRPHQGLPRIPAQMGWQKPCGGTLQPHPGITSEQLGWCSTWLRSAVAHWLHKDMLHGNENINELIGKYYTTQDFDDYKADTERPLPMIYQSGYLTIKKYKRLTNSYLLDFPNDEVRRGFITKITSSYLKPRENPNSWVLQVIDAMEDGDLDQLKKLFTSFLASIPYSQRRKDDEREKERYFQYTFYLIMRMISSYTIFIEKEQSEGRVDCTVETSNDVYIFEFKLDGSADAAIEQIKDKGYAREYEASTKRIHLIGCNFSSETGTIDGWEVRKNIFKAN